MSLLIVDPISPSVQDVHADYDSNELVSICFALLLYEKILDELFDSTMHVQNRQRNAQKGSLHHLIKTMASQIHPRSANSKHEENGNHCIYLLLLGVNELKEEYTCQNSCKLGMPTRISVIFWAIVTNIPYIMMRPIRPRSRIERFADGEEVGIEQDEDDRDECRQFSLHDEDEQAAARDDEKRVDENGEEDEEIIEKRIGVFLHLEDHLDTEGVKLIRVEIVCDEIDRKCQGCEKNDYLFKHRVSIIKNAKQLKQDIWLSQQNETFQFIYCNLLSCRL